MSDHSGSSLRGGQEPPSRKPLSGGTSTRSDYHVTNALGTTLATFEAIDMARAWVRRNIERFPSIRVERVTYSVTRETVYRPARPAFQRQQRSAA
jgi:hypothetical protein